MANAVQGREWRLFAMLIGVWFVGAAAGLCVPTASRGQTAAARGQTARRAAFRSFRDADVDAATMEVVEGVVPSWLRGAYLRNGPGLFEAGGRQMVHWFDGFAMLLRVELNGDRCAPRLTTRFIGTEALKAARAGALGYAEFMTPLTEPGSGAVGALRSLVALAAGDPTDNACVNLVQHGGALVAMTETQRSWTMVDPTTLETRQPVPWASEAGSRIGVLGTAHPQPDPADGGGGGLINVATDIFPPFFSSYQIYTMSAETPWERELLASIPCDDRAAPRWLHSFGVTAASVVVIEQPAAYDVPAMLGVRAASHGSIEWLPERGTRVHVLDRASGGVTTHVVRPCFFFFHVCNTFEADGAVSIDLCAFDDPEIVSGLALKRLTDDASVRDLPRSRIVRLSLPKGTGGGGGGEAGGDAPPTLVPLDDESVSGHFADLPTINPRFAGNGAYRYVYGIGASRPTPVANTLVKSDVAGGGGDASFAIEGMLPGEPLFVPRPGGTAEDDGVLISMGTDPDGGSSLYVLAAEDMRLLARCRAPVTLPAGFHGEWIPEAK